jgi:hypothetical protein
MMKNFFILALLYSTTSFSQIIISPYILYTDTKNKFGTFLVQNEADQPYEIDISFIFGYPVTDSIGNATMKYIEHTDSSMASATEWIRAFPRKFVINPGERQKVRMTVSPPPGIPSGTYWSRIVTSATAQSPSIDTLREGVRAEIKFVLNQITTLIYRVDPTTTGITINNFYSEIDSGNVNIYARLIRTGNTPFFGNATVTVRDSSSDVIVEDELSLSDYFDLVKKFQFPLEKFDSGEYKVELKIMSNEKEVFPESTLIPIPPILESLTLTIP